MVPGEGSALLQTDYYGKELTQLISFFGKYDLARDGWVIPNNNVKAAQALISSFTALMATCRPNSPEFEKRAESLYLSASALHFAGSLPEPLYEHQLQALPRIVSEEGFLLADDMGLGKSITSLSSINYCVEHKAATKILVFCQKRAIQQWLRYADRFTPALDVVIIEGVAAKRRKVWESEHTVYITNLEKIINDFKLIIKRDWDFIILDEASYFIKNPESKRARYIRKLKGKRRLALTGTPIENNLVDLYSLFTWLKPGFFESYAHFERQYIVWVKRRIPIRRWRNGQQEIHQHEIKKIVGYKNTEELKERIAPYFLRRTEDDVGLDLPKIVSENFIIPMLDDQARIYRGLVEGIKKQQVVNTEFNRVKLLRACDHSTMANPDTDSSNKIEILLSLLDENNHRKTIVFSQWADMIYLIHRALVGDNMQHAVVVGTGSKHKFPFKINDQEEFEKFEHECNILIATDAVSRSQDFPFASVVINVDLPWNPATIQQRIMRARRLSSTHSHIFAFNIVSQGTIEETVLPVLENKIRLARDIIDKNKYADAELEFNLARLLDGDMDGK